MLHQNNRLRWVKCFAITQSAGHVFQNYAGPQLSHQNQMLTANYKALTSNSNRSHQIQIAHSKFKSVTANYKSVTANYKSLTANSNRPQQIQIAHSKFKSFTANKSRSQQIQIAHSKLQIINPARRLRLYTASGTTRLKIFVIHEAAIL